MSSHSPLIDPAAARSVLRVGDRSYAYHRLDAAGAGDLARLPYTVKVLLENALRHAASGSGLVSPADVRALASWDPTQPAEAELPFMPARVILQDFTGVPCVVDLAAMRDAVAAMGGDPVAGQPAGARRPGDRPLRAGRPVRLGPRLRRQRGARVRAQRRALRAPALGAAGLRQLPGGAARDRDRAPGQPGVPGRRGDRAAGPGRRAGRLPRHAGRHRLAHDHDQRPRRRRLGRGRDRGRGRAPGPAALPADAGGGRLPPRRRAARRRHRHRPGAVRDRDAAQPRRGRQVRRVPRPGAVAPGPRGPRHDQQHVARVRRHRDPLPDRRRDAALPAHDRSLGRGGGSGRGVRQGAGPLPDRCLRRAALQRVAAARPGERRAIGRRAAPSAGPRPAAPTCAAPSGPPSPRGWRSDRPVDEASEESFPASRPALVQRRARRRGDRPMAPAETAPDYPEVEYHRVRRGARRRARSSCAPDRS